MAQQTTRNRIFAIQVSAAQLTVNGKFRIELPFRASKLVLPAYFSALGSAATENPQPDSSSRIAVQVNDSSAPMLVFGLDASAICEYEGPIDVIFVSALTGPAASWYLYALDGVDIKFSGEALGGFAGTQ